MIMIEQYGVNPLSIRNFKMFGGSSVRIGQFIEKVNTTKDTVRHYEELNLIAPQWMLSRKDYTETDIQNFYAIQEMKALGMTLSDIQLIFELKKNLGCSTPELLTAAQHKFAEHLSHLEMEENKLRNRRLRMEEILNEIKNVMDKENGLTE
jgi:DNA-binding transcriptional MerR regulator